MVAQTRHGANPQSAQEHRRLAFKDKLISKGQSTDALLKKLRTVHEQLAQLDQEIVELKSLDNVQKELLNTSIMLHRDRGVKAYAACCLADILRLCAPKAPYTPPQLRDIFEFFAQQLLKGLEGTDAAYYGQYYFLLESLSTVKSVVLVCDLQDDELFSKFFTAFFTIVRRSLAKKVELFMADILIALIDESHSVPEKVLETLQAQFMDESSVSFSRFPTSHRRSQPVQYIPLFRFYFSWRTNALLPLRSCCHLTISTTTIADGPARIPAGRSSMHCHS